ncbi:uncharacterized protein TNCV_2693051 [Trichonephila clavipes]|uniref:Uncharacterized protein n=1 Tax=Trichonephila clavipes TaxID=2585209 RepID=A0A8X7BBX0_TRICX|nr:uncharacterized protein TNCV_2693051 [Trichonephila clavipes]
MLLFLMSPVSWCRIEAHEIHRDKGLDSHSLIICQAAVAEWYRYRTLACLVTSSSPVPLKTRRVEQRCTLNVWRAETSSRWCGVVVRRGVPAQVSSTSLDHGSKIRGPSPKSLRVAEQCDVNIQSINQSHHLPRRQCSQLDRLRQLSLGEHFYVHYDFQSECRHGSEAKQ